MTLVAEGRLSFRAGAPSRALRYLAPTAFVVDFVIVGVTGTLAELSRDHLPLFQRSVQSVGDSLGLAGPLMLGGWLIALWVAGGYSRDVFGAGTDEYRRVLNASLLAAGGVGVGCYLAKFPLSRGFFLLVYAIGIPALILGRFVLRRALYRARMHGALMQRVVIAGTPSHVDEVAHVLRRETWLGYQVIGALVPEASAEETMTGVPVLGTPEQMLNAIEAAEADVIFLAGGALDSASQLRRLAWQLEEHDVQVIVAPSVTDVSAERIRVRPVGGLPLMHLDKPRALHASRAGKRIFDIAGSTALLVLFAPLMAMAALWVKLYDGGPVFFAQVRAGRDGSTFRCLKFRSMVADAEDRLAALHAESGYSYEEEGLFKLEDDPRITAPGRWLRRFSLDELPQLVNVLRGEMSLVGPRPPLPSEVAVYASDTTRRLRVRPGMTGLWQVSGRADVSFDEAVRLDLYYVDNWSMLQDLAILVRTVGAVVGSRGAY
jgi:exopolysaccharide biosynthesis polyprenyl glycosylphosphotransferase